MQGDPRGCRENAARCAELAAAAKGETLEGDAGRIVEELGEACD